MDPTVPASTPYPAVMLMNACVLSAAVLGFFIFFNIFLVVSAPQRQLHIKPENMDVLMLSVYNPGTKWEREWGRGFYSLWHMHRQLQESELR